MAKIRIAFLQHGLSYGGAPLSLYLLQKSLDKNLFEKYLFTTSCASPELKDLFLRENKEIHEVKLSQIHNNQCGTTSLFSFYGSRFAPCKEFINTLKSLDIDLLHINATVFPHLLRKLKAALPIKIVTHVRELIPKQRKRIISKYLVGQIYKYSDAIVAITDNEAQPFLGHPKLQVIPNPFDFAKINSITSSFRQAHNITEDCVLIGMLGQFHKFKGHLTFLQALKYIMARGLAKYPFMFIILGVGIPCHPGWKVVVKKLLRRENYLVSVESYIQINNLSRQVKLLPFTLNIFEVLKALDIVVRPALTADPWGRDIIEAMALSKPVVATGASEFYIENGVTGYLVPPGQPQAMAEKILELINDPEKRTVMGDRGSLKIRRRCDLVQYGQKMTRLYLSLTHNPY